MTMAALGAASATGEIAIPARITKAVVTRRNPSVVLCMKYRPCLFRRRVVVLRRP